MYSVTVDPLQLEMLYENFTQEISIPATISFDSLTAQGTLAFRGGTSLWCSKKSWHITLDEETPLPIGEHILLNAQYRDPSLMRNTLGMLLTRNLGYPAPETEFVTLNINGSNMGVYERIERIDRRFYQRNGLGFGPLFKNVDVVGRLVCQYSDTIGTAGFEPKVDSQPYGDQLLEVIEACFQGSVSSLESEEFLAAFAVNTAISDRDGLIKNFYLHRYQEIWHFYPWDRDATFGNSWLGEYDSCWVTRHSLQDIGYFGASRVLLSSWDNIATLNCMLASSAERMEGLPAVVDSLRLLIRADLAEDPYYKYSTDQFDSLCSVLSSDIAARGEYLQGLSLEHPPSSIGSIEIESCLDMQSSIEIELEILEYPADGVIMLASFDGNTEEWFYMQDSGDGLEWVKSLDVPDGTYSVNFAFAPWNYPLQFCVFYPSWSMRDFQNRPAPTPAARVALAELDPEFLSPGNPVWCGENLWVLPVKNDSPSVQDLSFCGFFLGDPPGSIFLPESTLVQPWETFYLTSNAVEASSLYSGAVYGDAGTPYPARSDLVLFDPSWNTMRSWDIHDGDSMWVEERAVIPSEISMGNGPDWIEMYNHGNNTIDLSGWYLRDSVGNLSYLPDGTSLLPGSFLLVAESPGDFNASSYQVVQLDTGIDRYSDSLSLYSRFGDRVFRLFWNDQWPVAETGMIYLRSPDLAVASPENWLAAEPPGTPGYSNPGWLEGDPFTRVSSVWPNPSSGRFSFSYQTTSLPVEAILYDLCGRVISRIDLPPVSYATVDADFSGTLPAGVYILYLRSQADADSVRLTILTEE